MAPTATQDSCTPTPQDKLIRSTPRLARTNPGFGKQEIKLSSPTNTPQNIDDQHLPQSKPQRQKPTSTRTKTVTITTYIPAPLPQKLSPSFTWPPKPPNSNPFCESAIADNAARIFHGIIPGEPRARHREWDLPPPPKSHSNPAAQYKPPYAALPTSTNKFLSALLQHFPPTLTAPPTTRSTYPRASPPGFLYPAPIVPVGVYFTQQQNQGRGVEQPYREYHSTPTPSLWGKMTFQLADLPGGYKVLFVCTLAVIVLGVLWAVVVWLVNFTPGGWGLGRRGRDRRGKGKREERRPIDKPSRYANVNCGVEGAVTSAISLPARYVQERKVDDGTGTGEGDEGTYELMHRTPRHRQRRSQHIDRVPSQTYSDHKRTPSSPCGTPQFSLTSLPSSPSIYSPPNPFLVPPNAFLSANACAADPGLKPRNSTEWLAQHAAFFDARLSSDMTAQQAVSSISSSPSLHLSPTLCTPYYMNTAEMEALEAGTAPVGESGHARSTSRDGENMDKGLMKRSLSWLDQGLGMFDGAVDGFVGKMTRWVDDDGGDEGILLPVVRRRDD